MNNFITLHVAFLAGTKRLAEKTKKLANINVMIKKITPLIDLISLRVAIIIRLFLRAFAKFFPIFRSSTAAQIIFAAIDRYRTAFAELKIVSVCTFYYITTIFALDLICNNLPHTTVLQPNAQIVLFFKEPDFTTKSGSRSIFLLTHFAASRSFRKKPR
jgi:hypothetical protein